MHEKDSHLQKGFFTKRLCLVGGISTFGMVELTDRRNGSPLRFDSVCFKVSSTEVSSLFTGRQNVAGQVSCSVYFHTAA